MLGITAIRGPTLLSTKRVSDEIGLPLQEKTCFLRDTDDFGPCSLDPVTSVLWP